MSTEDWIPLGAAFATVAMLAFAFWLFFSSLFRQEKPADDDDDEQMETLAVLRARAAEGGGGFRRFLDGTGLDVTPAGAVGIILLCGVLLGGAAFVYRMDGQPWPLAITAFLLGAAVPTVFLLFRRNQVRRTMRAQLPDVLFLLARSLRAGRSLEQAFHLVGEQGVPPLSLEFARMYRQLDLGIAVDQVVRGAADRLQLVDFNVFASVVSLHRSTGGNLPVLLDRLAISTRDRIQFEGLFRSATVLGRYSTGLIGAMVALILVYFFFFQNDPVQGSWIGRYFDTSMGYTGVTLFSTAIGFVLLGALLMFWLLRADY